MLLHTLNFFQLISCQIDDDVPLILPPVEWDISKKSIKKILKDEIRANKISGGSPLLTNIKQIMFFVENDNSLTAEGYLRVINNFKEADEITFTDTDINNLKKLEKYVPSKIKSLKSKTAKFVKKAQMVYSKTIDKGGNCATGGQQNNDVEISDDDINSNTKGSLNSENSSKKMLIKDTVVKFNPQIQQITFLIVKTNYLVTGGVVTKHGFKITGGLYNKRVGMVIKCVEKGFFLQK